MATEEVIIDVPAVDGIRVRQEPDLEGATRTIWRIEQGQEPLWSPAAAVIAQHPRIDLYEHAPEPIVAEQITLTITGESTYSSRRASLTANVALGVAVALQEASDKMLGILKQIEPQVADRLEKRRKLKEQEEAERIERGRKREEYNRKSGEFRDQINELEAAWVTEVSEVINWYEGQAGRLKRRSKKGWDTFHELGAVTSQRGGYITWVWNHQSFGDRLIELDKLEIRYESERSFEKIALPKYPSDKIDSIRKELNSLERVW